MNVVDIFRSEHYSRGIKLYDNGLYTDAIAEFEQVLDSGSGKYAPEQKLASFYLGESYTNLGLAHLRMSMYRRAEEELKFALVLHPEYADLHFHLAVAYYKQQRLDEAVKEFRKALDINSGFARALIYYGLTLLRLGDNKGLAEVAGAVAIEPAYDDGRYERAMSLYRSGRIEKALDLIEAIASTDVDQILNLLEEARGLMQREAYQEATSVLQEAVSVCPQYADLRHHLGQCYAHEGMMNAAIEQYLAAIKINPAFTAAHINLALAYEQMGKIKLAVKELQRTLDLDPANPIATRKLEELQAGG